MKLKFWVTFALISIVTVEVFLLVLAYELFWPIKTLTIENYTDANPIIVETPVVKPGQPLIYTLNYCKYDNSDSTVHRSLIDGQIITLTPTTGQLPLGCHTTVVRTAVIPETVNPGRYYLDVTVTYKINPFHTISTHYRTNYFKVVKGDVLATSSAEQITVVK